MSFAAFVPFLPTHTFVVRVSHLGVFTEATKFFAHYSPLLIAVTVPNACRLALAGYSPARDTDSTGPQNLLSFQFFLDVSLRFHACNGLANVRLVHTAIAKFRLTARAMTQTLYRCVQRFHLAL